MEDRKKVREIVRTGDPRDWDSCQVSKLIAELNKAVEEAPDKFRDSLRIELEFIGDDNWGDECSYSIYFERPETDAEMNERIKRLEAHARYTAAQKEMQERAAYEMLKRKYG